MGTTEQSADKLLTSSDPSDRLRELISQETCRVLVSRFAPDLRAIVLTGSLARNEGTAIRGHEGWRLFSDADFFLVSRRRGKFPCPAAVETAKREIEASLSQYGVAVKVGLAFVDEKYLRGLPRHISPFELRSCGRVVWGDETILSAIPSFDANEISREDAWRLFANRMIETLEVLSQTEDLSRGTPELHYRIVKLYLDMATSFLVFCRHYQPTYRSRQRALDQLATQDSLSDTPFSLQEFADRVRVCTRFKIEGNEIPSGEQLSRDAFRFAPMLWRWELRQLTEETRSLSDTNLMRCWMKKQPVTARLRGWASVFRRTKWFRSWRGWPRWAKLCWQASPRYWIYGVAADLFLSSSGSGFPGATGSTHLEAEMRDRLPLSQGPGASGGGSARENAAMLVAMNYRYLLESTNS